MPVVIGPPVALVDNTPLMYSPFGTCGGCVRPLSAPENASLATNRLSLNVGSGFGGTPVEILLCAPEPPLSTESQSEFVTGAVFWPLVKSFQLIDEPVSTVDPNIGEL